MLDVLLNVMLECGKKLKLRSTSQPKYNDVKGEGKMRRKLWRVEGRKRRKGEREKGKVERERGK
ncbi:hypothetical protein C1H46_021866 [Malus baccata]|uniref:Uncharacterized protein n=1 Tax=Malus baccata TaxID=106549 RepID=A0A540M1A9_MALBA|nr:hypothetical protein C1H46_021866 [Malus baccata]